MSRGLRGLAGSQHELLGVAFVGLLVCCCWLTYAIFNQSFSSFEDVTLRASHVGLQLPTHAEVKLRGVEVGEVRSVRVVGHGVALTLGLYPRAVHTIPANVSARIEPKTLFGEKFVALQMPSSPSSRSIRAGDVITESRVAVEVEKVLSDVYPLLRTVQPAQLNYTLTAVADALEGRGERLGRSLVVLDGYLKRVNPQIPLLVDDLRKLSSVSGVYRQVVPDVADLLRNGVRTGRTFVDKEQEVKALFDDVAGFSSTTRDFLERNGDNVIRLSRLGRAQLPLFARYSPEYPCLFKGLADWIPRMDSGWRGHTLHIDLETLKNYPTGYTTADSPRYAAHGGPTCWGLPHPAGNQAHPGPQPPIHAVDDGVHGGHGKFRPRPAPAFDLTSGYAGTAAERTVVDGIAAPVLGVPAQKVPAVASLLFAPLARGTEVSLR